MFHTQKDEIQDFEPKDKYYDPIHFLGVKSEPISKENLSSLKNFHKIPSNHPIFHIETENGHFILKNCFQQFENEVFTTNLAHEVGLKFKCFQAPEMVLLSTNSKRFHNFINLAAKLESKLYKGSRDDHFSLKKLSNVPFVALMEYKCGIPFDYLTENDLSSCILKNIGSIIAFDILINNWDRFPLGNFL
jgi:hypothetical protein